MNIKKQQDFYHLFINTDKYKMNVIVIYFTEKQLYSFEFFSIELILPKLNYDIQQENYFAICAKQMCQNFRTSKKKEKRVVCFYSARKL